MGSLSEEVKFKMQQNFSQILTALGQDVDREGLKNTPKRYVKFMENFLTREPFQMTKFENEGTDQMVIVEKIPFHSLCEHHTLPFFGLGWIAYIPDEHIVGISKLPRTLQYFSAGLQNQERITEQVATYIEEAIKPKGVAVCLKAIHTCMSIRGAKSYGSHTTTTHLTGVFKDKDNYAKSEFLSSVNNHIFT